MKHATGLALCALALACVLSTPSRADDISSTSWSESAGGNAAAPPNGFPEGMAPSAVNDSARELMAALRRWYDRTNATRVSGGTANAQTLTYSVPPTACVAGDGYSFIAGYTNTGAATLNNGGCTAPIRLGANDLSGGEIVAGHAVMVFYDGAAFQLLSGGSSGGGGALILTADDGSTILTADDGSTSLTAQ